MTFQHYFQSIFRMLGLAIFCSPTYLSWPLLLFCVLCVCRKRREHSESIKSRPWCVSNAAGWAFRICILFPEAHFLRPPLATPARGQYNVTIPLLDCSKASPHQMKHCFLYFFSKSNFEGKMYGFPFGLGGPCRDLGVHAHDAVSTRHTPPKTLTNLWIKNIQNCQPLDEPRQSHLGAHDSSLTRVSSTQPFAFCRIKIINLIR